MYVLPHNTDVAFMLGKELLQVSIGLNEVILGFHGNLGITIQSAVVFDRKNQARRQIEAPPDIGVAFLPELGKPLINVAILDDGSFELVFSDETRVTLLNDSPQYECFQVWYGKTQLIV